MTAAATRNCESDEYDEFKEKADSLALAGDLGSVLGQLLKRNCSCTRLEQALQRATNGSGEGASMVSLYCEPFPIELPWWLAAVYLSLFCLIILLAVGGNLTVVWIVLGHQRMRTVTNYFLVNLAIADASISVMNVGFSSAYNLYYDWRFGVTYCYINNFMGVTPTCASVFTMMAMTFDRYIAIVYPLRPRLSKKKTLIGIALIWLVAVLVGLPQLFVTRVHWGHFYDPKSSQLHSNTFCYSDNFPNNLLFLSGDALNNIYAHLLFTAQYLVPLLVLSVTYILVAITLWGSQPIGDHHQSENIKAKRKVVKMLGAVVAIFMICWFPYQLYFVFLQKFMSSLIPQKAAAILYVNMYGLAMSSTVFNPFIYCWMNSRFRIGFKYVFRWLPFIKMSHEEYRNSTLFDPRRGSRLGTFSTTTPAANTFAVSSNTRRPSPADRKASTPVGATNRRRNRLESRLKSGQLNMKAAVSVDEANENNNLLSQAPNLRRATTYDRPTGISNEPLLEATVEAVELSNF